MENNYVLDTNIILRNPNILSQLHNAKVIIPSVVLQELDKFKNNKEDNELKMNGRFFVRLLDELREKDFYIEETNTIVEVKIVSKYDDKIMEALGGDYTNDDKIIYTAYLENQINPTYLVSDDGLMRMKGSMLGLDVLKFTSEENFNKSNELYQGFLEIDLADELIDTLYREKFLDIKYIEEIKIYPHMFFLLKGYHPNKRAMVKVDRKCRVIELIENFKMPIWGITPRNAQQIMAMHLLLDPDIPLVTLVGDAGTGKTLLAIAAALLLTQDERIYEKLTLAKPTQDMGKGIGFLPGGEDEKLGPYMESYMDTLHFLFGDESTANNALNGMQNLEIKALNYIRGRSLPNQLFIVDEVQNLTKHEIKTIVTRMGEGSKVILMGDPNQIDHPFLDYFNNGLSHVVEKFKDQEIGGHITLTKGERSTLASIASKIL